jgi:hypothetical protein
MRHESVRGALTGRRFSLALAISLILSLAFQLSPNISPAHAALYTTNLAFHLDANNSSSYNGSGDIWYDISGQSRNFTRPASGAGRPSFQTGPPKSFLFTRASNSGAPPSNAGYFTGTHSWLGGGNFTVSAWIKTTSVGGSTNHWELMQILSAESGGGAWDWGFGIDSNGKLAFGTGLNDITFSSPSAVNTGSWIYVAATRQQSNGVIRLYTNGSLVYTSATTSNTSALQSNSALRLGAGDDGGLSFGGNIGAVLGYNALLTDAQIADNFEATKGNYGFATATTTTLTVLNASTTYGAVDTLTATVNSVAATGTVNFLNNGSSISGCSTRTVASGVATCPFIPPSTGTFANLTAVYSGDASYATSTSGAASVTVTQAAPALSIAIATSVPYRTNTAIIATSSPAGTDGKVSFTANGKRIAGCLKLQSASLSTTCNWQPTVKTQVTIRATLTPTSSNFTSASALPKLVSVYARSTRR